MGRYNRNGGQPKRDDGRKRDKYGVLLNVPGVYKDGIKIVKPKAIEVDMSASFKKAHALPALPAPSAVMQRVNLSHENRQLISELIEDNASSLSTLTLNDDIGGGKQERGSDQMEPIVATSSTDPAPSKQASAKRSKPRNHGSHSSSVPSDGKMDAVSAQLLQTFQDRQHTPAHKKMSKSRSLLPAWQHREHIVSSVASHQVVIISGETGCGKSTQVPQFLLHDCIEQGRGSSANIICTQPRRISAIGVAQRVAAEMCEDVGRTVGYNIRLEKCESRDTRLLFCTTGVLLRRLEGSSSDRGDGLQGVSHIIVDEVSFDLMKG
jgi:HrpA-like RNA helicase